MDLKRRRNAAFVPICRIPSELIEQIFANVQHGGAECDECDPWLTYHEDWVRVLLVCHRFHDVAIRTPALWRFVDRHCADDWTDLCMERSQDTLLCIRGPPIEIAGLVSRASTARLDGHAGMEQALLCLNPSSPDLAALEIINSFIFIDFAITASILERPSISLVRLVLSRVSFSDMPPMPRLRHLELLHVQASNRPDPGLQPISTLANAPGLEIILIDNLRYTTGLSPAYLATLRPISLPCLRIMMVLGRMEAALASLRILPLPSLALGIHCARGASDNEESNQTVSHIYQTWQAFMSGVLECVSLPKGKAFPQDGIHGGRCVEFGPPLTFETLDVRLVGSFSFECDQAYQHPIFDDVETLLCVHDGVFISLLSPTTGILASPSYPTSGFWSSREFGKGPSIAKI